MRADGVGARVVQHVHATLRAALEHAYREEIVPRNVAKLVRTERPIPQKPREPLTADEATHLLKKVQDTPRGALWTVMVMLGLRRSEACGLRWEHVDFERRTLRIAQTVHRVDGGLQVLGTKTRRSNRTVPLRVAASWRSPTIIGTSRNGTATGPADPGSPPATSSARRGEHPSNPAT
jgi:integrase